MDFRIFIEPQQGTTYDRILALAAHAESLGFNGFFTSDHYLKMGAADGLPGPTDAWTTLAGLARDTSNIRLGTLVSPVTFRHLGSLAISVAQIDQMSEGRVELGLGAGWYEEEHKAQGLPFPDIATRFDLLEESLEVLNAIWNLEKGEFFNYQGKRVQFENSMGLPKPKQEPGPPIIMGGIGQRRTPNLVAKYASEYNTPFVSPDTFASLVGVVKDKCVELGRNPKDLIYSCAQVFCCGDEETIFSKRALTIGREVGELRVNGLAGTPDEVIRRAEEFKQNGCDRLYLQILDDCDLEHLDLAAEIFLN